MTEHPAFGTVRFTHPPVHVQFWSFNKGSGGKTRRKVYTVRDIYGRVKWSYIDSYDWYEHDMWYPWPRGKPKPWWMEGKLLESQCNISPEVRKYEDQPLQAAEGNYDWSWRPTYTRNTRSHRSTSYRIRNAQ